MSAPAIAASTSSDNQHEGDVTSVAFHKDHVYSAGADGKIKVKIFSQSKVSFVTILV